VKIEVIRRGQSDRAGRLPEFLRAHQRHGSATPTARSRWRGTADSATSGWIICINDQPSLDFGGARNPTAGFAVPASFEAWTSFDTQRAPNTDAQR
jgi:hypothetical protein